MGGTPSGDDAIARFFASSMAAGIGFAPPRGGSGGGGGRLGGGPFGGGGRLGGWTMVVVAVLADDAMDGLNFLG